LQPQFTELNERVRDQQLQGRLKDRDIRRFLHDLRIGTVLGAEREDSFPVQPMFPAGIQRERDFDYFAFEELYRGDETSIRERQKSYLECFRGRQNVLDVGCGRGEFLELLRENNISAKGVELGTDQYLLCREKGLDVIQQDLFAYLESLADESLGGLFSSQVIEHLTASDQLRYVRLAYEKTMPGSPVVFETINAQCVWAVMRNFFLDPTHVRPIHPETLKFAMETVHFREVKLLFSSPMSDRIIPPLEVDGGVKNAAEFNQRLYELNLFLYGNQDYAAIGWH
jgi:O-antigen chain-terminating methyltransferase